MNNSSQLNKPTNNEFQPNFQIQQVKKQPDSSNNNLNDINLQPVSYMASVRRRRDPFFDKSEITVEIQDNQDEDTVKEFQSDKKHRNSRTMQVIIFILTTMIEVICMFVLVPYSFCLMLYYFYLLVKGTSKVKADLIDPMLTMFFSSVKCYIIFQYIFQYNSDSIDHLWVMNAFYLLLSLLLVLSYIKCIKNAQQPFSNLLSFSNFINKGSISNQFIQLAPKYSNEIFDINNNISNWREEYKRIIEVYEVDLTSQRFNTFFSSDLNPTTYDYRGFQLFLDMNHQLQPLKTQFFALLGVAFLKIAFTMLYLFFNKTFTSEEVINIIIITFFYFNYTFSLNTLLSNYDLRRKKILLKNINGMLKVSGEAINYFEKLDIASSISIETWDNSRRCIYDFFTDEQKKLEACYICLFFYYIFVALACASFYGEFYIFFSKESIHLRPLMIISYSMDFILYSIILLIRIHSGERYNDSFEKSEHLIDNLIGLTQDLIQMYDYYFSKKAIQKDSFKEIVKESEEFIKELEEELANKQNIEKQKIDVSEHPEKDQQEEQENENENQSEDFDESQEEDEQLSTIYDILVAKLKQNSNYFIINKIEFLGQRFDSAFEKQLQLKMMKNMLSSYKRIKMQIAADSSQNQYKFLNYFPVRFQETLIPICLGLGTVIPSILTKFIQIFTGQ